MIHQFLNTIPSTLVSARSRQWITGLYGRIPGDLADTVGVEIRLDDDGRVDLLFGIASIRRALNLSRRRFGPAPLPPRERPFWDDAARLAACALRRHGVARPLSPAIWLEFDLPGGGRPRVPGVFTPTIADADAEPDHAAAFAEVIIDHTAPRPLPAAVSTTPMRDALHSVAAGGVVIASVGLFPGRDDAAVRLWCPMRYAAAGIMDSVRACGWRGDHRALSRWAEICEDTGGQVSLDLDVGPTGMLPTIGIEVAFDDYPDPHDEPSLRTLLQRLERGGLCRPDKRAAVEAAGRYYTVSNIRPQRFRQYLNSLKISMDPQGRARAKAYVGTFALTGPPALW